jgi:hypothetical protein
MRDLLDTKDLTTPLEVIREIIRRNKTQMILSRKIKEDIADISKWKKGQKSVGYRAAISICRCYPDVLPWELNPKIFPKDLRLVFVKNKSKS